MRLTHPIDLTVPPPDVAVRDWTGGIGRFQDTIDDSDYLTADHLDELPPVARAELRRRVVEARDTTFADLGRLADLEARHGALTRPQQTDAARLEAETRVLAETAETLAAAPPATTHRHAGENMSTPNVPAVRGITGEYLAPEQRVADWSRAAGATRTGSTDLDFGKVARGFLTGRWKGAEAEHRDLFENTTPGAGYLVPEIVSAQVIDYARNQARVIQAGARTIPLKSDVTFVPRQTDDPTMQWLGEGATSADGSMTFDRVQFITKTLRVLVKASRELIEDAETDLANLVMSSVGKAVAVEIDRVGLYGTGPGTPQEPLGLKLQTGVNAVSLGANGAAPTWDDLSESAERIASNNFDPGAFIMAPRTAGELARLKDAYGRYLGPPPDIAGNPRLATNQVPVNETEGTATTSSDVFCGDWSNLLIGVRTQLQMMTLTERYIDELEVGFFAYMRADVQLAHPGAFDILTGVL